MESAPPSATEQLNNQSPPPPPSSAAMRPSHGSANTTGLMGKHRMAAAIAFLNQQIQFIQDEIDELDTVGGVSSVCPEIIPNRIISSIDSVPDALLSETRGPTDVGWDRWFQGAQSSKSRRRWI